MRDEQRANKGKIGYDRRCRYLSPEERAAREAEGRPWVVRLAVPVDGTVTINDAIRGDITFSNAELQDAVLMKSDGWPTYHLANIVDDHFMAITHIMRGDEWLSSVPLHWHLYEAFGWEPPIWAHLPVILSPSGKGKVSKRAIQNPDGSVTPVFVHDYKDMGYLPDAVDNFLNGIGWALDGETEIYDRETAIEAFSIASVQASPGAFPRRQAGMDEQRLHSPVDARCFAGSTGSFPQRRSWRAGRGAVTGPQASPAVAGRAGTHQKAE